MGKSLTGKELGEGIFQRKEDGRYVGRYTDRFGKRRTIYSTKLSELRKRLRDAVYEDEKQYNTMQNDYTLDEWFDIWINVYKVNCRDTSIITYKTQYNSIRDKLGWVRLSRLNRATIQKALNELQTDAMRQNAKARLVDMLNCAAKDELILKNYAADVVLKRESEEKKERNVLTDRQIELLYLAAEKSPFMPALITVALQTGMRIGEIIGLKWGDINFDDGVIYVRRTLCAVNENGKIRHEFHPPKTESSKRSIPMTSVVCETLIAHKGWRDEIDKKYPARPGFEDLVFVSRYNCSCSGGAIDKAFRKYTRHVSEKFPEEEFEGITPHCLRHTFATRCIESGMRPKTLQRILGHTSLKMTMDLYCHVTDDSLKTEMKAFEQKARGRGTELVQEFA